jgi:hypothetical protein
MRKSRYILVAACLLSGCVLYTFQSNQWGFEGSTSLPSAFTTADPAWTVDASTHNEGTQSARSASPAAGMSSSLTLSVGGLDSDKDIHFSYRISGSYPDALSFYINGILVESYYATDPEGAWIDANVWDSENLKSSGENSLRWVYEHNAFPAVGSNCAWIDDISIDG